MGLFPHILESLSKTEKTTYSRFQRLNGTLMTSKVNLMCKSGKVFFPPGLILHTFLASCLQVLS